MSIAAAPPIVCYRDFVESIQLARYRKHAGSRFADLEKFTDAQESLFDELWNTDHKVEYDYFEVIDAPSRVDYLLLNRDQLLSQLEHYVTALSNMAKDGPPKYAGELVEVLEFSPEKALAQLEELRRCLAVLDRTHVLMDQHLRDSMIEHDFDFTLAGSYEVTEYTKANAWFYSSLSPIHAAYFEQPTVELLTEYISTAREIQASEHPLLGDPAFATMIRLSPALREQTASLLDELTTAELMSPLLLDQPELGVQH